MAWAAPHLPVPPPPPPPPLARGFWRSLVPVAGVALLVVLWTAIATLSWYERTEHLEVVGDRNALFARVFADDVTRDLESLSQATGSLVALLQRGAPADGSEMRTSLSQLLVNLPFLRGVAVLDAQGHVLGSSNAAEIGRVIPIAALGRLPAADRDRLGGFVRGRGLIDAGEGNAPPGVGFLPMLRTLRDTQGRVLVVVALINPQSFGNAMQVTLDSPISAAALLTYEGQLVAATTGVEAPIGTMLNSLTPYTQFLPRLESGAWRGQGLRASEQMAVFRVSASRPLVVVVETDRDAALSHWRSLTTKLVAAGGVASLLIALLTWLVARSVTARRAAQAERDAAQQVVAQRERELSITIRSVQELIFRTDAAGIVTFVNDRWSDLSGGDPSQAIGRPLWPMVVEEEREAARALFSPRTSPGVRQLQAHLRDRDGALRAFDIALIPLLKHNELVGFAGSAVDVTERSVAQARLQTQLAFTELLMQSTPVPMSVLDAEGRYVRVNQAWEEFTGFKASDVVGHGVGMYLSASGRAEARQQVKQILLDGQAQRVESSLLHADGTLRDMLISRVRLPVERGQPAGVLSLMIDVTDLRRAERATREARDAAEEASRAKSEFIANISHELRTPLQSIIGFSELGIVRGRAHERLATMFGDIHASGQRMLKLVNDLLDVSKIESTVGTIHLERADLRGLAREVAHELEPQMLTRGLAIDLDLPEYPVLAKVDPMRMQQVLRNVLANAVKFSPAGVRIRLRTDYNPMGEPVMSVHDRGPGIPESELESIFEAFVQSTRTKDGSGGTGLGLAITRKIVQAHGGRIHAENAPEGGAVFHIVLPARGAAETQPMPL